MIDRSTLVSDEKAFEVQFPTSYGESRRFVFRFQKPNSWGAGKNADKGLNAFVTVRNATEAALIVKALAANGPLAWREASIVEPGNGKVIYKIGNHLEGFIAKPEDGVLSDGSGELRLYAENTKTMPESAAGLIESLNNLQIIEAQSPSESADMSTLGGKREWAYYSFLPWARALSHDEKISLREIAGSPYREIHAYLRKTVRENQPSLDSRIARIDSAISKGNVNRDVTVYRADSNPNLLQLWNEMNAAKKPGSRMFSDNGYTFCSLDPNVAYWWATSQLRNESVQLEILIPKGSRAAYIDAENIHTDRGYLELLFPRGSKFEAIGAKKDSSGRKVLSVRLVNNQ